VKKYSEKDYFDAVNEFIDATVEKHEDEVQAIYAGGSIARGDFAPGRSDIDIYVVARGEKENLQKTLEEAARKIEEKHFEELGHAIGEVVGVTVTSQEEIRKGTSFLGTGFEYRNFINNGKLLWGEDIKALIPKPTPKEQKESAKKFLDSFLESVPEWERKFKWLKLVPFILIPRKRKEQLTRQAFCLIFRTAAVALCGQGEDVSAKEGTASTFQKTYREERELCDIISRAVKLWEKWRTKPLSDKETKRLLGNSLKFAKGMRSLQGIQR